MTNYVAEMASESFHHQVGARLRTLRLQRDATLAVVAEETGISVSTLSRLESGRRRASLELLLPLARSYRVTLDELVDAPSTGDPRVHAKPSTHGRTTTISLTNRPGGLRTFKTVLRPSPADDVPDQRSHEGYEWLYILDGRLRLLLGDQGFVLKPGEAVEFDTRVPHWFGCGESRPVEFLCVFGPQGERMHMRR